MEGPVKPFSLKGWINDNRQLLKPPVGNATIYQKNQDFIVMVVGGPNSRTDFHRNEGEELFFQIEGDIRVDLYINGKIVPMAIQEGDMFLVPSGVPHRPVRGAGTVGLVIERYRESDEKDGFLWVCDSCNHLLHKEEELITDIVSQLPPILARYNEKLELSICKNCGHNNSV